MSCVMLCTRCAPVRLEVLVIKLRPSELSLLSKIKRMVFMSQPSVSRQKRRCQISRCEQNPAFVRSSIMKQLHACYMISNALCAVSQPPPDTTLTSPRLLSRSLCNICNSEEQLPTPPIGTMSQRLPYAVAVVPLALLLLLTGKDSGIHHEATCPPSVLRQDKMLLLCIVPSNSGCGNQ